jgi:cell division septum initiation protein DivIVA
VFTNYKGAFLTPEEYNGLIDLLKVTLETFT